MPQNGDVLLGLVLEAHEVEDKRIDDLVGQGVLLVDKDSQEQGVGAGIVHVGQADDGRAGVEHGDRDLAEDRADNGRFLQGAGAGLRVS